MEASRHHGSEDWAKKCQRLDLLDIDPKVRSGFGICWRHFKRDDYRNNDTKKRRRLKPRVVPSLYLCANPLITEENRTVDLESNKSESFVCVKFSSQKYIDSICAVNEDEERCENSIVNNKKLLIQSMNIIPNEDETDVDRVNNKSYSPQCRSYLPGQSNHLGQENELPAIGTMDEDELEPESSSISPTMIQSSISNADNGPAAKKAKLDATPQPEGRSSDGSKCFICDSAMVGKKYSLASCMTNGTKVRLVEVLGRLVCDNYMVVVSHGDFICRGCANLLNTLDRLDAEITSVKRIVLNFVERKYRLGDRLQAQLTPTPVIYSKTSVGSPLTQTTLMSNKKVSASPAPQTPQSSKPAALSGRPKKTTPTKQAATPLNTKTTAAATPLNTKTTAAATPLNTKTTAAATPPITKTTAAAASTKTNTPVRTKSFKITLKDEQILGQSPKILQTAEDQVFNKISAGAGTQANLPRNVWMQCNQCQYTTNQRSVMLEHLRQHVASRSGKDAAKTPASKPTSSSATTTTTTTTTASTSADKTVEATSSTTVTDKPEDAPSTAAEETPTTSADAKNKTPAETNESEKPITITVDANVASGSATPTKQTIIVRQTSESAKSPGIVSKMLAGNKVVAIQNPPPLSTPVVKIITTSKTDTKSKVKVPATPQIFSSTKKKSQPDPSMPSLLGDDDL